MTAQALFVASCAALIVWVLVPLLAPLWLARGWTDPSPSAAVPERKRGQTPAPVMGGWLLLGAVIAAALHGSLALPSAGYLFLATSFAIGWLDDRWPGGLGARVKVAFQVVASAPLAAHVARALCEPATADEHGVVSLLREVTMAPPGIWCAVFGSGATVVLALIAYNVLNTWDHADGVLATFVTVAFAWAGAPIVAGASAALLVRQLRPARSGKPFLGDGGSHLAGALVLVVPATWPFLWLPALDLARVVSMRFADGQHVFEGDRRHLGAALGARGVSPALAALLQALVLVVVAWALS